jgi:hypothetical protein
VARRRVTDRWFNAGGGDGGPTIELGGRISVDGCRVGRGRGGGTGGGRWATGGVGGAASR